MNTGIQLSIDNLSRESRRIAKTRTLSREDRLKAQNAIADALAVLYLALELEARRGAA